MKLIKQIRLFFQEGNSDKVYEIDLCEAGEGYLVNFRYGRRGASLKEGTKTIFPVALTEAEKIFDGLEQEKRKKGYAPEGEVVLNTSAEKAKPGKDKRKKAIVAILKAAASEEEEPENWPLSRVIWRAGSLNISEAVPYIIKLVSLSDSFEIIYSAVWTIGRCGSEKAIPFLKSVQEKKELAEFIRTMATEALFKLCEGKEKEELINTAIATLPLPLQRSIQAKQYAQLEQQLRELLFELHTTSNDYLTAIYQIARQEPELHQRFSSILSEIPLQFNYFKHLRHIFKAAEMLEDYNVYGIIAKSIEKQKPGYKSSYWYTPQQKKQLAFSEKTKLYLTQRVVRQLNKFGTAGEHSYTTLAAHLLLAYDDVSDAGRPHSVTDTSYHYDAQTRNYNTIRTVTHYDSYSSFQAFNYILYKNSTRYQPGKKLWKCIDSYVPGNPAPEAREEAFPLLWNKAQEEIILLLCHSKVSRVHEFALKVWKANPDFANAIDSVHLIQLLKSPFAITQQLALDIVKQKYVESSPDFPLLAVLLDSLLPEARTFAAQWIEKQKTSVLNNTEFLSSLLLLQREEAHTWLRSFLSSNILSKEISEMVIARIIAHFITLQITTEEGERQAAQTGETLVAAFGSYIQFIALDIIKDLFRHASPVIHAFAGKILLKHFVSPEDLPEDFLQILLQSSNASSRGIGISLLGKFPEHMLLERKEILVSFCLSPMADVRDAVKPLISKLVSAYPQFGTELVHLFVPAFLMKESYEGVHNDLLHLLSHELKDSLAVISKERTLVLLKSKFKIAQSLGATLLKVNIKEEDLSVAEMVKLADNPLLEVRTYAWDAIRRSLDKMKSEKAEALHITDSIWEDTRSFAFDYFRTYFTASDWTTELLVSLCDSVKEDVQDFGREMLSRSFKEENGEEYLLKLSQHPNNKVQLYASAFLEKYAADNIAIITKLKPFFITLLSQINKGRVAKARVMTFLRQESLKNEDVAVIASEIFTRVSVSVAIKEKTECIEALRDIQKKYPAIASVVHAKAYPDYIKA